VADCSGIDTVKSRATCLGYLTNRMNTYWTAVRPSMIASFDTASEAVANETVLAILESIRTDILGSFDDTTDLEIYLNSAIAEAYSAIIIDPGYISAIGSSTDSSGLWGILEAYVKYYMAETIVDNVVTNYEATINSTTLANLQTALVMYRQENRDSIQGLLLPNVVEDLMSAADAVQNYGQGVVVMKAAEGNRSLYAKTIWQHAIAVNASEGTLRGEYGNDVVAVKRILASGDVCLIGIPVLSNFSAYPAGTVTDSLNITPVYTADMAKAATLSGLHALCVVGYDDARNYGKGAFLAVNSWGGDWGWYKPEDEEDPATGDTKGYIWLGYDFVQKYCDEAWRMVDRARDAQPFYTVKCSPLGTSTWVDTDSLTIAPTVGGSVRIALNKKYSSVGEPLDTVTLTAGVRSFYSEAPIENVTAVGVTNARFSGAQNSTWQTMSEMIYDKAGEEVMGGRDGEKSKASTRATSKSYAVLVYDTPTSDSYDITNLNNYDTTSMTLTTAAAGSRTTLNLQGVSLRNLNAPAVDARINAWTKRMNSPYVAKIGLDYASYGGVNGGHQGSIDVNNLDLLRVSGGGIALKSLSANAIGSVLASSLVAKSSYYTVSVQLLGPGDILIDDAITVTGGIGVIQARGGDLRPGSVMAGGAIGRFEAICSTIRAGKELYFLGGQVGTEYAPTAMQVVAGLGQTNGLLGLADIDRVFGSLGVSGEFYAGWQSPSSNGFGQVGLIGTIGKRDYQLPNTPRLEGTVYTANAADMKVVGNYVDAMVVNP
jgi:hypothetical protein